MRSQAPKSGTRAAGVLLAAMTAAVLVAPLARAQSSSPSGDEDLVLRVGTTSDLITDNPWAVSAGSDWSVVTIQYDMLLKFASKDLGPAPSLATGCEPNEDSTEWTCTLRDDLKWSDGTPLTSRDVAFTYRFVIDNKIPQYRSYFPFRSHLRDPERHDADLEVHRAHVRARHAAVGLHRAREGVVAVRRQGSAARSRASTNTPSIASGPFTLTDWNQGQGWTMERNPYFWGEQPALDRIEFRLYSNQEAMIQALRNGEIDIADGLKPSLDRLDRRHRRRHGAARGVGLVAEPGVQLRRAGAGRRTRCPRCTITWCERRSRWRSTSRRSPTRCIKAPRRRVTRSSGRRRRTGISTSRPRRRSRSTPRAPNDLLEQAGYVDTDGDGIREDPDDGRAAPDVDARLAGHDRRGRGRAS